MTNSDLLITGISQLATPPELGPRRGGDMARIGVSTNAAIAVTGDTVSWVGPLDEFRGSANHQLDLGGRAVIPALVDPHTHAIWAGDRLADFEAKAAGVDYETILSRGGGIRSTVEHTAAATVDELVELAVPRVEALIASGAATIEVKSGYGFDPAAELRSLEAIIRLTARVSARLVPTLLIHIPPAAAEDRIEYLRMVTEELIPEVASRELANAVDIFVEREAWTAEDAREVFAAAAKAGLQVKAHVDQFQAVGGISACVEYKALSADHLEASGSSEVAQLAASNTVATLLPGVTLHLGIGAAPGRDLIDAGAIVAVGTDLNPGSSPLFSTQQAMALAVRINGLSPAEALTASTVNSAAALGLRDTGAIVTGARADLLVLSDHDWRAATWALGASPIDRIFVAGVEVQHD